MKIQIVYSSLTGKTERLAKAIYEELSGKDSCTLHNLKDGRPELDGDIILLGYWVDKGGPEPEMKAFMESIEGKAVGVFCTLAAYADSVHAHRAIVKGVAAVQEKNIVIGSYVCNGAVSQKLIEAFRQRGTEGTHSATPQNEIRWKIMADHPTEAECRLGAERFRERVEAYELHRAQNLEFRSVLPEE